MITKQLSNGSVYTATITLSKQSGTSATFYTTSQYVNKDIVLNMNVRAGNAFTPATTINANPTISVNSNGLITATTSASSNITPTISAGWISNGTSGVVDAFGSATYQLPSQAAQTITPGSSNQTISSGRYLVGNQTILGDANLVPSNIKSGVSIFGVQGAYTISGITLSTPSSGTKSFYITVPNGSSSSYVTFNFVVDSEGNTTITGGE